MYRGDGHQNLIAGNGYDRAAIKAIEFRRAEFPAIITVGIKSFFVERMSQELVLGRLIRPGWWFLLCCESLLASN
ncbi:MAG: hypothetical protein WAM75_19815 [Xanthobacteraceae bacterium]